MIVGYHSPLPPAASGAADYAADLLSALRRLTEVRVNAAQADVHFYQLGNNHLHREAHDRAVREPGVALLHDANLHHFYLGTLSREAYVGEFCRQYGEWHRSYAEELWRERARSGSDPRYFIGHPMLGRVVGRARAVIVHNPAAAAVVLAARREAEVHVIPHYFAPRISVEEWEVARLRAELGVRGSDTVFAIFGHLRESKRLAAVLRAFAVAHQEMPSMRLLVAGQFVSEDFARAIEPLLDAPGVLRTGFLPERDFWLYAQACDVCINLRYPSCGESSGIATRLMGIGKPVMHTEGDEQSLYPEGSWLPVPAGVAEERALAEWMRILSNDKRIGVAVGRRAAEHIRREHALERVAERFLGVLRSHAR